ncbi:hypothetical protein PSCICJ_45030 [Pseudomonas cichorii]|nr:hypothetical protein PSCICJ_45030 [Pseudomonas cichorii]
MHVNHVTEGFLCIRRDAYRDTAIGFGPQPFVFNGESQLAHNNSSRVKASGVRWCYEKLFCKFAANIEFVF